MKYPINRSTAAFLDLYPDLSESEVEKAQIVLRNFVEAAVTIYRNALRDPERRVALERLLTESANESRIRIDQGRVDGVSPQGE